MNIKKVTLEDRFARKYFCNPNRFVPYMKRRNRRMFRRMVKRQTKEELRGIDGQTCSLNDRTSQCETILDC